MSKIDQKKESLFKNDDKKFNQYKRQYNYIFDDFIEVFNIQCDDPDMSLSEVELSDPMNEVVCLILYLHTIEPNLASDLIHACRYPDMHLL